MTLLSVLWRPGQVDFSAPGLREQVSLESCSRVAEIRQLHGNLVVEVKDGKLTIGWPVADRLVPNMHMTAQYRRLATYPPEFYPEISVSLPGKPELIL